MTVLITIAALFAVQIYAPAFAGAWPRMSGSGHVAFKRGGASGAVLPEMPEFPFPSKPVKLKAAASFKARKTARPKKCMANMQSLTIF